MTWGRTKTETKNIPVLGPEQGNGGENWDMVVPGPNRDIEATTFRTGICVDWGRDVGVPGPYRHMGTPHSGQGYGSAGSRGGTRHRG